MSYAHYQSPFWEFLRSMDRTGAGVDYSQRFGYAAPPGEGHSGSSPPPNYPGEGAGPGTGPGAGPGWFMAGEFPPESCAGFSGRPGGHRGRGGCPGMWGREGGQGHCSRDAPPEPPTGDNEKGEAAPAYDGPPAPEGSDGAAPGHSADGAEGREPGHPNGPHRQCHGGRRHWGRGGFHRGGRRGFPFAQEGAFDMSTLMEHFSNHPIAQAIRSYAEQFAASNGSDADSFVPPVDIFLTPGAYILHVALPGAKREDVGVNWNPDKGELSIAGVVYRPGDEEFIKSLHKAERRIGMFERKVKLPPAGGAEDQDKADEIDGDNITAKLEDGLLVVTVPKVEKEWTDIKKVDIE